MIFSTTKSICAACGSTNGAHSHDCRVAKAALAQQAEPLDIKPPNPEGATQAIVRWWAETPHGWVGSWNRAALEYLSAPPAAQPCPHIVSTREGTHHCALSVRKPLTDEEIEALWWKWVGTARPNYSFARAIERAHGITQPDDDGPLAF